MGLWKLGTRFNSWVEMIDISSEERSKFVTSKFWHINTSRIHGNGIFAYIS